MSIIINPKINPQQILQETLSLGLTPCVDAVLVNDRNQIFIQKRSGTRRLFPNCWEFIGGHVDEGEELIPALAREVLEELNLELTEIIDFVDYFDWESGTQKYRNMQFLAKAKGVVVLELDKSVEGKWIDESEVDLLLQNRTAGDDSNYQIAKKTFGIINNSKL